MMTREAVLALYQPMRLATRRITSFAGKVCSKADLTRAAKQIGIWTVMELSEIEDDDTIEMVFDVALFEPSQRGRIPFNTLYQEHAERLDPSDRALARQMTTARFSLFHAAGPHEVAGVWLEDLLDGNRRLSLMSWGQTQRTGCSTFRRRARGPDRG